MKANGVSNINVSPRHAIRVVNHDCYASYIAAIRIAQDAESLAEIVEQYRVDGRLFPDELDRLDGVAKAAGRGFRERTPSVAQVGGFR